MNREIHRESPEEKFQDKLERIDHLSELRRALDNYFKESGSDNQQWKDAFTSAVELAEHKRDYINDDALIASWNEILKEYSSIDENLKAALLRGILNFKIIPGMSLWAELTEK